MLTFYPVLLCLWGERKNLACWLSLQNWPEAHPHVTCICKWTETTLWSERISWLMLTVLFFFSGKIAYLSNFKKDLFNSLDPWVPTKLNGFWPWKYRGSPLNTWYHNTSVFWAPLHSFVSSISNCKKMRRSLVQLTSFILLNRVSPIDVQQLVRIHRNNDFSNECVDTPFFKSAQDRKRWKKEQLWLQRNTVFPKSLISKKIQISREWFLNWHFVNSEFNFRDNA